MSAIYGMYHWGGESYTPVIEKMEQCLHQYRIDRFATSAFESAEFGCGLQCFTQEAEREVLPVFDERNQLLLTADVVLDNRSELMGQLGIDKPDVADGRLVYLAYVKWGEEFVKLLRGVFAIAIYDGAKKCLFLYTDHTGSREINYYNSPKGFLFSTTFAPILEVEPSISFNERWITACEAARTPDMELFPEITPYTGILQLEAGTYLRVEEHSVEKVVYWDPTLRRDKMPFDDGICRQLFLDTFRSCVKDVLRSRKNTAATVSSGLDSTSVASLAAGFLEKEGKSLYTYTSVPEGDFETSDAFSIANEAWGPQEIQKKYPNVKVHLEDCKGMDGFTKLDELVRLLEVPTKSAPNMMWIDEIYKKAREQGCYVIVKGQYGNATISYGKILSNLYYQVTHGHFVRAYREMKAFGEKNRVSRKQILRKFIGELRQRKSKVDITQNSLVMDSLLSKYEINRLAQEAINLTGGGYMDSEEQSRNFLFDKVNLAQLGLYDTHFSLLHGVLVRDPTKDKRMIELCMSFPLECFVHDGVERRLAREYMSGIVPSVILNQTTRRGLQSADYVQRVKTHWGQIKNAVIEKISLLPAYPYLDEQKLEMFLHHLGKLEELSEQEASGICAEAFNLYAFSVFLQMREEEK